MEMIGGHKGKIEANFIVALVPTISSQSNNCNYRFLYFKKNLTAMILERTNNEILVRLPANVDLTELQNMIDYIEYKEFTSKTKAKQKDVDELSETVNNSIWNKVKAQRKLQ